MSNSTTSSRNGARAKVLPKNVRRPMADTMPVPTCRALSLLRRWMVDNDLDVAKLSRKIDRTWDCTYNIVSGKVRPDVDAVVFFEEKAGVPVVAWMEPVK
jgi:hypothetical protein